MRRASYALAGILVLTSCKDSTAPPLQELEGTYVLTNLPVAIEQDASHSVHVVGSRLTLTTTTYMAVVDVEASYTSPPRGPYQNTSIATGTYTNSGATATFTSTSELYPIAQSGTYAMTVGGSTLTRQVNGITFVYQKQ